MKTIPFVTASVLTTMLFAPGAFAQAAEPSAPATAVAAAAPLPAPDQVVYIPRLPSATEVTSAAVAQGLTVEKIAETSSQIIAVYRRPDGQVSTVAYQLLPAAGSPAPAPMAPAVVQAPAPVQTVVYAAPAPVQTVVYAAPAPAYYYDPFYYPWPWFGGVVFDIGVGHGYSHFGGRGYRGGYRGGDRGGSHGGHHR